MLFNAFLALGLRFLLDWDNQKLDKKASPFYNSAGCGSVPWENRFETCFPGIKC
jgi:hypothetical protein